MDESESFPDEVEYEEVMPLVVVKTQGGPYDDESFVAGWQAAQIEAALGYAELTRATAVGPWVAYPALHDQLDLVAMKKGFQITEFYVVEENPGWAFYTFSKPSEEAHLDE